MEAAPRNSNAGAYEVFATRGARSPTADATARGHRTRHGSKRRQATHARTLRRHPALELLDGWHGGGSGPDLRPCGGDGVPWKRRGDRAEHEASSGGARPRERKAS
jgi:hypothetical protein